jgi:hypothetical protein
MGTKINLYKQSGTDDGTSVNFNVPRSLTYGLNARANDDGGVSESDNCTYNTLNDLVPILNSASLVVTPSSYKEGKLYSVIPSDGSGDMSVTRATTATRVNSAGLVELVPYNFLLNSEDFSTWSLEGGTMTSGQLDPLGGNTAYKYDPASGGLYSSSVLDENQTQVTYSFWAKSVYGGNLNMTLADGGGYNTYGTISIDGTWTYYTFTLNRTTPSVGGMYLFSISNSQGFYIWHPQINTGSVAKEYFPTTNRLNIPRLDYSNGTCPSLLVEPQRTNLALYSNALSTGTNVVDASTITANFYVSPDGTQNAMQFTETTDNSRHGFYQYTTVTAQTYTASIFTKQTGRRYIALRSDITGTATSSFFDLQTISVLSSGSGHTCSIQDFGNGWLRLVVTFTASAGSRYLVWCGSPDGINVVYAGSTSISQTFYGYQLEAGSYPTSYIPTTSASVTRNADVISKTGISSLIGQTEGVIFLDIFASAKNADGLSFATWIIAGDAGDNFQIYNSGTTLYWYARNTAGLIIDQSADQTIVEGTRYKIAFAYKSGDYALYINGVQKRTNANANVLVGVSQFNLSAGGYGASPAIVKNEYNATALWKTRLTNDQLEQLTGTGFDTYAAMASFYNYTLQ